MKKSLALSVLTAAAIAFTGCKGKKDTVRISNLSDLQGKIVVVQQGSSGETALNDFNGKMLTQGPNFYKGIAEIKKVPDYQSAFTMLQSGAADAVALDSAVAKGFVSKSKGTFRILVQPLSTESYGIGFKLGNEALRDVVQYTLNEMTLDGTVKKILDKWVARPSDGGEGIDYTFPVSNNLQKPAPVAGKNTFTVGFDASFPPYGFKDAKTGECIGFDLDLAKEVAKRNGWKIILKPIDWDAKDAEINSGNIDCIWNGFTITEEREKQYTWSAPYVTNAQLILVRTE